MPLVPGAGASSFNGLIGLLDTAAAFAGVQPPTAAVSNRLTLPPVLPRLAAG